MSTTLRRPTTRCLAWARRLRLRAVLAVGGAGAVIGLLSIGAPSRSPDFVWRGAAGATTPGPRAAAALRAVARVLAVDYKLPLPARLVARSYASRDSFVQGLVTHAWLEPERAAEMAGFAAGIALPGSLLLRGGTPEPTPDWIRLVAHELTHVAQLELAGGEAPAARWLGEGMAEWVAYGVLARTVPGALEAHRRAARPALCAAVRAQPLGLGALGVPTKFVERVLRGGARPTYHLAFYLVDDLVRRAGFASVRAYFGAFRESIDATVNFEAAFGLSLEAFERAVTRAAAGRCPNDSARSAPESGRGTEHPEPRVTLPVTRPPVVTVQPLLVVA